MRRSSTLALVLVVAAATLLPGIASGVSAPFPREAPGTTSASAKQLPADPQTLAVPGEIVVEFVRGTGRAARSAVHARLGAAVVDRIPGMRIETVRIGPGRSLAAALARYRADPSVADAEPNLLRFLSAPYEPDDERFAEQWGMLNTGQSHPRSGGGSATGTAGADGRAAEAWGAGQKGSEAVIVAVIDTGVDATHPDLDGRLVDGWNFVGNNANTNPGTADGDEHGTFVAGIIAANQDDGIGVTGVCPLCRIMPLKVGTGTQLTLGRVLKAIDFAIDNGAHVINASYSAPVWSNLERRAIQRAGNRGVLFVAASGNERGDNDIWERGPGGAFSPQFPASYNLPSVLAVGASNHHDRLGYVTRCAQNQGTPNRCTFTNWGRESVDVMAPGVDIVSTIPGGYAVADGTSMAAPYVAGGAGLALSGRPGLLGRPVQLKNVIMNGVDRPSSLRRVYLPGGPYPGRFTRTNGRVNALKALSAPTTNATPVTDGNIDGARLLRASQKNRLAWPNDVNDVYRKRLKKGQRYEIRLTGPKGRDYDLYVWKPGTREIWQLTLGCYGLRGPCPIFRESIGSTANETIRFRAPRNGVFYVHVTSWFSTGGYTLRFRRL